MKKTQSYRIAKASFAVIGAFVTFSYTAFQVYDWLFTKEYKVIYEAYEYPMRFPSELTGLQQENTSLKVLFNYVKKTGNSQLLKKNSPDSIIDKIFQWKRGPKPEFSFIYDTTLRMPLHTYEYYDLNTFQYLEFENTGEKEVENLVIRNLNFTSHFEILQYGFDIDGGILPLANTEKFNNEIVIRRLSPNMKVKIAIWTNKTNQQVLKKNINIINNNKPIDVQPYFTYPNGKPQKINFDTPHYYDWNKTLIFIASLSLIPFSIVAFYLLKRKAGVKKPNNGQMKICPQTNE